MTFLINLFSITANNRYFLRNLLAFFILGSAVSLFGNGTTYLNGDQPPIKVKGDSHFPPFEFINENGVPDGFNVELFHELMNRAKLSYTFTLEDWSKVRKELSNKEIDMVIGMTFSNERAESALFGMPHSMVNYCIVTRKGEKYNNFESLRGKTIIVQDNDRSHERLIDANIADSIVATATPLEGLKLLSEGKYDAMINFEVVSYYLIKKYGFDNLNISTVDLEPETYSLAANVDNVELLNLLNTALYQMKIDGDYDKLYTKWFGVYEKRDYFQAIRIILIVLGIGLVIIFVFIWQLRHRVRSATKELRIKNAEATLLVEKLTNEIAHRQAIEEDLIRAKEKAEESDRLKMAFLANVSHEIRTPLNAIVGFSELIQYTEDHDEQEDYKNIINNNNELLLRLIGDILDLSKIDSGTVDIIIEKFDVVAMFFEVFAMHKARCSNKSVVMTATTNLAHCIVQLDRNRVTQVMSNFLSNALKYIREGSVEATLTYENRGVKISVKDTGIGIPQDKQHLIFQRFEKLDSFTQGTGLGLAICKAIMDAIGGQIGFESHYNEGSFFWAWFPADTDQIKYEE